MSYLYLKYDKENLDFEKILNYVNYQKFPRNENCRVNYQGSTYDFFVLDELKYGISNKIFRIENNGNHKGEKDEDGIPKIGIHFIDADTLTDDTFPEKKETRAKAFLVSLGTTRGGFVWGHYGEDYLKVGEDDYWYLADLIWRNIRGHIWYMTERMIEIFVLSGSISKLMDITGFEQFSMILDLYDKLDRMEIAYKCRSDIQTTLFIFIEKSMDNLMNNLKNRYRKNTDVELYDDKFYAMFAKKCIRNCYTKYDGNNDYNTILIKYVEIAIRNISTKTTEENFKKIVTVAKKHKIEEFFRGMFDFYGEQIYGFKWRTDERIENFKQFAILQKTPDEIVGMILKVTLDPSITNYLFRQMTKKVQAGLKISDENLQLLVGSGYSHHKWNKIFLDRYKKDLFISSKGKSLVGSKTFTDYRKLLNSDKDEFFKFLIISILMDNIKEIELTKSDIDYLWNYDQINSRLREFLESKDTADDDD